MIAHPAARLPASRDRLVCRPRTGSGPVGRYWRDARGAPCWLAAAAGLVQPADQGAAAADRPDDQRCARRWARTTARSLQHAVSPGRRYGSAGCGARQILDGSRCCGHRLGPVANPAVTSHSQERPRDTSVRLVGGPLDGARDIAFPGEILKYEADSPPTESSGAVPLLAWYVPSRDDANVYVFGGVERDAWRMYTGQLLPPGARAKKPRVYELAAEFGVESKVIMLKLQEMGEFVRSASSTVEHPVAHRLRLHFAAQTQRKPRSSG